MGQLVGYYVGNFRYCNKLKILLRRWIYDRR
nr:MAG TPA: hypothetical protein [Caudoviricetes sp.]